MVSFQRPNPPVGEVQTRELQAVFVIGENTKVAPKNRLMDQDAIINTTKIILVFLMQKAYQSLIAQDIEKDLPEEYVRNTIEEHGGEVGLPDDLILEQLIDVYETDDPNCIYIDLDLWIDQERSDLTLSYVLISSSGKIGYALKDIHIL